MLYCSVAFVVSNASDANRTLGNAGMLHLRPSLRRVNAKG